VPEAAQPRSFPWRALLLGLSFTESFSTVLLERGIYFFSYERLGFSEIENLWLALRFGAVYAVGALASHPVSRRVGERRLLVVMLACLLVVHATMAVAPRGALLVWGFALTGFLQGVKWPLIESYVGSGLDPKQQLAAVGRFNLSWALAVPLALAVSGPLIASGHSSWLFVLAGALNGVALLALPAVPAVVPHLEANDPARPPPPVLDRYERLLGSSRWSMLASYSLLFLIAPLMPEIFRRLGESVERATLWAAWLDGVRVLTFAVLSVATRWHGRFAPLVLVSLGLPSSFCAILFGPSLGVVLLGEVAFGVFSGLTYYAALYYAMVVKNAAVEAGGVHESLIGLGFALGPGAGLVGHAVAGMVGQKELAVLAGVVPLLAACLIGSLRALLPRKGAAATT